jgi:hypothetical protein
MSEHVIDRGTDLRARHGFKTPDAIHLATAREIPAAEHRTKRTRARTAEHVVAQGEANTCAHGRARRRTGRSEQVRARKSTSPYIENTNKRSENGRAGRGVR